MGLPRTKLRLSASCGTAKIYDRPGGTARWIDEESDENVFRDARLGKRFRELLIRMGGGIGESIPLACQDWANTKAAYRFFANERVRDKVKRGGKDRGPATRFDRCEILDPQEIQGNACAQAEDQSNASSHREE